MDDDISLAIKLQAYDRGIFDEDIINLLIQEHERTQHDDLDIILRDSFYLDDDFDENK